LRALEETTGLEIDPPPALRTNPERPRPGRFPYNFEDAHDVARLEQRRDIFLDGRIRFGARACMHRAGRDEHDAVGDDASHAS
jgi:hypothetical protein